MVVKDIRDAIVIARNFVLFDIHGPFAEYRTFEPISVEFDENNGIWIIVCSFKREGTLRKAKVKIDSETEKILEYKLIEE